MNVDRDIADSKYQRNKGQKLFPCQKAIIDKKVPNVYPHK